MSYKNPADAKKWRQNNKARLSANKLQWDHAQRELNPEKHRTNNRRRHLKHLYGITPEEYEILFQQQNGVCAICGQPPKKFRLAVDHDHESGIVRGLLCRSCNRGIGIFRDDPYLLQLAVAYLLKIA